VALWLNVFIAIIIDGWWIYPVVDVGFAFSGKSVFFPVMRQTVQE
jgi:hypothetical protein